jgi:Flp pilus assembly protein TadD
VGLVGNTALASAVGAAEAGNWTDAEHHARTASGWAPWSATPLLMLGEAQLAQGDGRAAHDSFASATDRDADDWRTWYELGRTGDAGTRRRALAQLERLDPLRFPTPDGKRR